MEQDEEDEIGVARCDGFVEGKVIFRHGEEQGDLFAGAGFVVQKLGCKVAAAFVVRCTSDEFKGYASFIC